MSAAWDLPGYVVGDLVGFGRHGDVWRGRVAETGEPVALKRVRIPDREARRLLHHAAATLAVLAPAHVARLRAVVPTTADDVVLVVELAEGGSLGRVLDRRGRLAPPEVVTLIAPLARTLAEAHRHGIVHGGVQAANVLFDAQGRPLLCDVALAVALGEPASAADDVHDLACLGALALGARDAGVDAGVDADLFAPTVPDALVRALVAAADPDPRRRPDATRFADAVLAASPAAPVGLVGRPVAARPPSSSAGTPPEPCPETRPQARPGRRDSSTTGPDAEPVRAPRPTWRSAAALLAAAVVAVVGGAVWGHHGGSGAVSLAPAPIPTPPWRDVVARLDGLRAQAFRTADPRLLDAVYAPASRARIRDAATLRSLVRRGLRARGFDVQVDEVTVESADATTARLRVVDTLTGFDLVDGGGRVVASGGPRPARVFELVLARVGAGWLVRSVDAAVSRPAR